MSNLLKILNENAKELDSILREINTISKEHESNIKSLEKELLALEEQEKDYISRIEELKNVPLPAIDYLLKQLEPSERQSKRREFYYFLAGIILSALVSIALNYFEITG